MTTAIRAASRVDARCEPFQWAWARDHRDRIEAHWRRRILEQPRLFDGTVLLANERRWEGDVLKVRFFPVAYSTFLAFKELGFPDPAIANVFALGALRSTDGAFILGIMGPHTANVGRTYFPAGTPDPSDVLADGTVDLSGSLLRELREETGIEPEPSELGDGWTVVEAGPMVALFRALRLGVDAAGTERSILGHMAADPDPELAGVRLVREGADLDETSMPAYLTAFLRHELGRGEPG